MFDPVHRGTPTIFWSLAHYLRKFRRESSLLRVRDFLLLAIRRMKLTWTLAVSLQKKTFSGSATIFYTLSIIMEKKSRTSGTNILHKDPPVVQFRVESLPDSSMSRLLCMPLNL